MRRGVYPLQPPFVKGRFVRHNKFSGQWQKRVKSGTTQNKYISSQMRSRADVRHPFCSSGGNLGSGRTRTAMYTDSIEQLRGAAGARQVKVRAETALAAFTTPSNGGWIMFGKHPS
jgi:hypothetical protein